MDRPDATETEAQPEGSFDQLGTDLSSIIGSIQTRVEAMRRAAEEELARVRAEREAERAQQEAEKARLEGELAKLRSTHTEQMEKLRALQEQIRLLLADYRGDLEGQIQRAYGARRQIDRVQQLLGSVDELAAPGTGKPKEVHSLRVDPGHVLEERRSRALGGVESGDQTVAMKALDHADSASGTVHIAIGGVMSVSAMMRARRAVEMLQGVHHVESRHEAGTLYFSVRSDESAEALASALTNLPDPVLRTTKVEQDSIELQMQ